jgi:hypothetical protein
MTVTALINSGAQDNFIDREYVQHHALLEENLDNPITLRYANGSINPEATVQTCTNLKTIINRKPCQI